MVLTAVTFKGRKKQHVVKSTVYLDEDAEHCVKSALHVFAVALTAENVQKK